MLKLGVKGENLEDNKNRLLQNIKNGKAYHKFLTLVENQGGDSSYIENIEKLPKAKFVKTIYSQKEGYVKEIDSKEIGKLVGRLGAGREKKEDFIDPTVGIVLTKKVADKVNKKDILAYVYINEEEKEKEVEELLTKIIKISNDVVKKESTVLEIIASKD